MRLWYSRRRRRKFGIAARTLVQAMLLRTALAGAVTASTAGAAPAGSTMSIEVLSNRADLIAAGDALVRVVSPAGVSPSEVRVALNGQDVTPSFAVRADGNFDGLVTGLGDGPNELTATAPGGGARITITNHLKGRPRLRRSPGAAVGVHHAGQRARTRAG